MGRRRPVRAASMQNTSPASAGNTRDTSLCLVRGDPLDRLQKALRLTPREGRDGAARRALCFAALAWLPLVIWALATDRVMESPSGEPLLRHLGIHARFLIALPLLIFGERALRSVLKRILPQFTANGLVPPEKLPAFREVIAGVTRLRDSAVPWVLILGIVIAALLVPRTGRYLSDLDWAHETTGLGFGGWWYLFVSRPLLQIFLLGWLWRIVLVSILLRRIAKLGLEPVATHPDRLGGLGFLEDLPRGLVPLPFAMSWILAAQGAHDILWHGAHVKDLKMQAVVFALLAVALCLAPFLPFPRLLKRARRKAIAEYDVLVSRHGRALHGKWISGKDRPGDELLDAPELGSAADVGEIYNSVRAMRTFPLSQRVLAGILVPVLLPLLAAGSIEIPVAELLGKILKTVF